METSTIAALTLTYLLNGSAQSIEVELSNEQACMEAAQEKVTELHALGAQAAWTCKSRHTLLTSQIPALSQPVVTNTQKQTREPS